MDNQIAVKSPTDGISRACNFLVNSLIFSITLHQLPSQFKSEFKALNQAIRLKIIQLPDTHHIDHFGQPMQCLLVVAQLLFPPWKRFFHIKRICGKNRKISHFIANLDCNSANKNIFCRIRHLEAVVNAVPDYPKDFVFESGQYPNGFLLRFRKPMIHKEIAQ